ncbi:MAG: cardiolipin synthase [Bacilli bacterium]|jgi:cardiolipin synthase
MKKLLKLLFGRMFWTCFFILILLISIVLLLVYLDYILETEFPIVLFVADLAVRLIVLTIIVNSKSNNAYKIAWLVVVGIFGMLGSIFYIMFANKKFTKRQIRKMLPIKKALNRITTSKDVIDEISSTNPDALLMSNYITEESGSALYSHSEVQYYPLGDDAFPVMLEELKKAEHYIFLEYFIIDKNGIFWPSILDILVQKVSEGVDVRVMYDDLGSISTLPSNYYLKLRKLGIKCHPFNRFKPIVNVKLNNRDHRKIIVIDGHTGFTGGINLADEYINKIVRFGHWKDNSIMIKGQAVYGLTMMFLSNWCGSTGEVIQNFDQYLPQMYGADILSNIKSDGYVQPYGDIPFNYEAVGEQVYLNLIQKAKRYIYIMTPYLIIDSELENSLRQAAKSGVEVIIIMPHIPDKKTIFNVTRSYYKSLMEAGVRIFEYTPGFVHAKMFVVDDIYGTVGTINMDYRSLYLHLECGTFLYRCSCLKDMKNDFLKTLDKSQEITPEFFKSVTIFRRFWWALLRIFAPLL